MGVWGLYGDRIARAMKFTAQALKDGEWKAVELPGAANILAWEESWRIFRTACIMLNIATAAVLDRYSAEFRTRVLEYPDVWHLAAQADIRCRSEWWPQEQRRQHSFSLAHPSLSVYDAKQPWNSVIKASSSCSDFWRKEFEQPALRYQCNGPRAMPAVPEAPSDGGFRPGSGEKRKFDPQRKDGRYLKSKAGINYDWSRKPDGCCNDKCDKGMAHICEWCRQPHRSIYCPQVPGWNPEEKSEPRGR